MPRIRVLPAAVADQIAAGEVVERPFSVVKELVENSLDAGATSVEIVIEEGGHRLIRVSDDGCGMDREDAVLALVRHGTSKIHSAADLTGVTSFGFRGEALPAITSISRFELDTSVTDGEGTRVVGGGGSVTAVAPSARRRGTTVVVSQLFFNVPARRKFLRSARSDWRGIAETVSSLALTVPGIRFTLTNDGRNALGLPPVPSLRARVAGIWGHKFAAQLLEVEDVSGAIQTSGLVERPSDVGTATRRVFVSVNGRAVRDVGIIRAAESAYRSTIAAGLRPSLFLDIRLPVDSVDVNVHPAKAEIRFLDKWSVERAVETAVRRALGTFDASAYIGGRGFPQGSGQRWEGFGRDPDEGSILTAGALQGHGFFAPHTEDEQVGHGRDAGNESVGIAPASLEAHEASIPELFQFRRTYIAFDHPDGLVLIDQHSAHERVLYEEFMGAMEGGEATSQRLLLPITIECGDAEAEALDAHRELFQRLGYEIESFGGSTYLLTAVPMPHQRFDAERCLRDTLNALTGGRLAGSAAKHEHLAATIACKAAIKAGDQLTEQEMRALFARLRDTALPAHDVHGRSTIVQLTWDELDRRFGRK